MEKLTCTSANEMCLQRPHFQSWLPDHLLRCWLRSESSWWVLRRCSWCSNESQQLKSGQSPYLYYKQTISRSNAEQLAGWEGESTVASHRVHICERMCCQLPPPPPPSLSLFTNTNIEGVVNRGVCLFRTQGLFSARGSVFVPCIFPPTVHVCVFWKAAHTHLLQG